MLNSCEVSKSGTKSKYSTFLNVKLILLSNDEQVQI